MTPATVPRGLPWWPVLLLALSVAPALAQPRPDPPPAATRGGTVTPPPPDPAGGTVRYSFRRGTHHRVVSDRNPHYDQTVTITETATADVVSVSASNRGPDVMELRLTSMTADNLQLSPADARQAVVLLPPDGVAVPVVTLRMADPGRPPGFAYATRITAGNSRARPDGSLYALPFARGARFVLSQGFGGSRSHDDPQNLHAVDFSMPVGTPVHAARGGVVVDLRRDAANDTGRMTDANYVVIRHADGTYGTYAHLDTGGVRVRLGAVVAEGELIGRSGNSGHSDGPHLHFCVAVATGEGHRHTVPWLFKDADGQAFMPRVGSRVGHDD